MEPDNIHTGMDFYLSVLLLAFLSCLSAVSGKINSVPGCEDVEEKLDKVSEDLIRLQGRFLEQEILIDRQTQVNYAHMPFIVIFLFFLTLDNFNVLELLHKCSLTAISHDWA